MSTIVKVFVRNDIASICHQCNTCNVYNLSINCFKNNQSNQFPNNEHLLVPIILIPATIFYDITTNHKTAKQHVTCYINYGVLAALQSIHLPSVLYLANYSNIEIATVLSNGFKMSSCFNIQALEKGLSLQT